MDLSEGPRLSATRKNLLYGLPQKYAPSCSQCGGDNLEIICIMQGNGNRQYHFVCANEEPGEPTGRHKGLQFPHKFLSEEQRRLVRIVRHNAPQPDGTCARCGFIGPVEKHHWAPRALFPDAEQWPKADLCVRCHRRWHSVVTPQLVRGGAHAE